MKKAIPILVISSTVLVSILFSCKKTAEQVKGMEVGNLYLSNEFPQAGDSLVLNYTVLPKMLEKDGSLQSIVRYAVKDKLYGYDMDLKMKDSIWTGTIHIPDSATAVIFNFEKGGIKDDNDNKGYVIPLFDGNNQTLKGSYASMANYYSRYGRFEEELKMENDSILALFEMDFENGEEKSPWDLGYASLLLQDDKMAGTRYIESRIQQYRDIESPTESDYFQIITLYNLLRNRELADSVKQLGAEKFPKKGMAQQMEFRKFRSAEDLSTKERLFAEFKAKFGNDNSIHDWMLQEIVQRYSQKGDIDSFFKYAEQIKDKKGIIGLYNNIAWNNVLNKENLDFSEKISKESLVVTREMQENLSNKPSFNSESEYKRMLEGQYLMFADTYALILFEQGKIKEAIKYQREAIGENKMSRPDVNERYVQFLMADQRFEEAKDDAMHFVRNNGDTEKLKEYLKEAYIKVNGSAEGFKETLIELEEEARLKGIAKIKEKMINEESHDFVLKNLEGEEVALEDLRGKTVILDFWATWCGPCIASFPGMQIAVDKYRENPNVVFLFIDTMEDGTFEEKQKKVEDFIKKNNYTFNVLFDTSKEVGSYATANKYGVNAIPTKVVIGPDGNIKYESVGSSSNPEKTVQEIEQIVEIIQQDVQADSSI